MASKGTESSIPTNSELHIEHNTVTKSACALPKRIETEKGANANGHSKNPYLSPPWPNISPSTKPNTSLTNVN